MNLYRQEMKMNFKSFLIWVLCVGGMCFGCILLYGSVESSLADMGDLFSQMGAMSAAFGMDRLSIGTLSGYYATEIAMIHSLGGAMFAAMLGSNLLSKEEFGHTVEFLAVLPISRRRIVCEKYLALLSYLVAFQVLCTISYIGGFAIMGDEIEMGHMVTLALTQQLLLVEVGTICFCISAFFGKNMMGAGLGVALLFFTVDLMCRIVPAIENLKYITPFYYCNATDIFTETEVPAGIFGIGIGITVLALGLAHWQFSRKDFGA